jgi:hypothetical protein
VSEIRTRVSRLVPESRLNRAASALAIMPGEGSSWPMPQGAEDRGLGGRTLPDSDYPSDAEDEPRGGPFEDAVAWGQKQISKGTQAAVASIDWQRILFFGLGASLVIIGVGAMIRYDRLLDAAEKVSNISTNQKVGSFLGDAKASDFKGGPEPPKPPPQVDNGGGRFGNLSREEKAALTKDINKAAAIARGVKSGEARRAKAEAKKAAEPKDVTPKPTKKTKQQADIDAAIAKEKAAEERRKKDAENPTDNFYKKAKRLNPDGTKDDYEGPMKP